jgi:hypothetical protein
MAVVAGLGAHRVHAIVLSPASVPPEGGNGFDCMQARHRDGRRSIPDSINRPEQRSGVNSDLPLGVHGVLYCPFADDVREVRAPSRQSGRVSAVPSVARHIPVEIWVPEPPT